MGIVKRSIFISELHGKKQKQEIPHGNDFDDSESAEVGSELIILGNQMIDFPYDLYDLPDLNGILSLDVWDTCLTEEERYSLAAFLPDMDQQTFLLTMTDLLEGGNIFFGNPLASYFNKLKGGLCSFKVSCFQKFLQFLEKQKHYHRLCSYNDNMVRKFMDMKRIWFGCQSDISGDERVRIWENNKYCKPVFSVDLNADPAENELLTMNNIREDIKSRRKVNCLDNKEITHIVGSAVVNTTGLVTSLTKPRGVLKLKPPTGNSKSYIVKKSPSNSWDKRPVPTGVLKVRPRNGSTQMQNRERSSPIHQVLGSEPSNTHVSSHGLHPSTKWDMGLCNDSQHSILPQIGGENNSSEFPGKIQCRGELLTETDDVFEELQEQISSWKIPRASRNYPYIESLGKERICCQGSMIKSTTDFATVPRNSGYTANSREEHDILTRSSDGESIEVGNISSQNPVKSVDEVDISEIPNEDHTLPITYKRKKASLKLGNSSNFSKRKKLDGKFEQPKMQEQIVNYPSSVENQ
ncbi:hypothetical protein ZOSMA_6G01120 [Zostera marina]|uniref:DEUBAD domain-containing protein n=1 Tax=Zostera marina TaxID=29655 RepID=A0A0K9NR01_ZOSMR|nr:hypothetical protein ZOSMA_6G01120 [Zostera marina]